MPRLGRALRRVTLSQMIELCHGSIRSAAHALLEIGDRGVHRAREWFEHGVRNSTIYHSVLRLRRWPVRVVGQRIAAVVCSREPCQGEDIRLLG